MPLSQKVINAPHVSKEIYDAVARDPAVRIPCGTGHCRCSACRTKHLQGCARHWSQQRHAIEGLTDSLALQLAPLGVQVSVVEPGAYRSNMDKNILARLSGAAQADFLKVEGPKLDPTQYPSGRRGYAGVAEQTIRKQIEQLVQLNEGQPYTFDRAALIKMLDEALTNSRPRTR
jgi:NAD(P)-dependent dehydrogenase (short-subunit alcohol dehydrogenase family)